MQIINCQVPIAVGYYPYSEEDQNGINFFCETDLQEGEESKLYGDSKYSGATIVINNTVCWMIPAYVKDNGGAISLYVPEWTNEEELQKIIERLGEGIRRAFGWIEDDHTVTPERILWYSLCDIEDRNEASQ